MKTKEIKAIKKLINKRRGCIEKANFKLFFKLSIIWLLSIALKLGFFGMILFSSLLKVHF